MYHKLHTHGEQLRSLQLLMHTINFPDTFGCLELLATTSSNFPPAACQQSPPRSITTISSISYGYLNPKLKVMQGRRALLPDDGPGSALRKHNKLCVLFSPINHGNLPPGCAGAVSSLDGTWVRTLQIQEFIESETPRSSTVPYSGLRRGENGHTNTWSPKYHSPPCWLNPWINNALRKHSGFQVLLTTIRQYFPLLQGP